MKTLLVRALILVAVLIPLEPCFLITAGASKQHIDSIPTRYGRDKRDYISPPSGSARKQPPESEKIK